MPAVAGGLGLADEVGDAGPGHVVGRVVFGGDLTGVVGGWRTGGWCTRRWLGADQGVAGAEGRGERFWSVRAVTMVPSGPRVMVNPPPWTALW